jgi:hypothetical protein
VSDWNWQGNLKGPAKSGSPLQPGSSSSQTPQSK